MTDRAHSLTVVLEVDIRVDDLEILTTTIRLLKGVVEVKPNIVDAGQFVAESRARLEVKDKLYKLIGEL